MSQRQAEKTLRNLVLLFISMPLFAATTQADTYTLTPGETLTRTIDSASSKDQIRIPIPAEGVMELYTTPGLVTSQPRLTFTGTGPAAWQSGDRWTLISETPRRMYVAIHVAGDFFVTVQAQIQGQTLPNYQLHTVFEEKRPVPDETISIVVDPPSDCRATDLPSFSPQPLTDSQMVAVRRFSLNKDVDPWEDDGISGFSAGSGVLVVEAQSGNIEVALHDGESSGFQQRVAEGSLSPAGGLIAAPVHGGSKRLRVSPRTDLDAYYDLHIHYFALCSQASSDDHSDRPLCATYLALAEPVIGRIEQEHDEDQFTFVLDAQETVVLDLAGGSVGAALFDENDQRLETWSSNWPIIRTLGPGRYYGLVAGSVDETYELRMTTLP